MKMQLEHKIEEQGLVGDEQDLSEAMATLTMNNVNRIEKAKTDQNKLRHKPVVLVGCKSDLTD